MLVPGEYVLNPAPKERLPKELPPTPLAGRTTEQTPVSPTEKSDDERPSFLLILLRALGAIHT